MNQNERVLRHLKTYGTITPLEALDEYGIFRLGARKFDLKKSGVHISREMVTKRNRFGEVTSYAQYRLEDDV